MTDDDKIAARRAFFRVMAESDRDDPLNKHESSLTYTTRAIDAAALAAFAAGVREGRERAAKDCEQVMTDATALWRNGLKADKYLEGVSDGASDCADYIRAQGGE